MGQVLNFPALKIYKMKPVFQLLLCLSFLSYKNQKPRIKIGVYYYSTIDKNLRKALLQRIEATYKCTITEMSGINILPAIAYYKPRNRYRATIILDDLNRITGFDKIIGITAKDISTTSAGIYDWGIMDLGSCPGKACIISTFRLKTPNRQLFNARFIKVALHEIGHNFGLPHCNFSRTCFMEAASGTIKSVDGETRFLCNDCKKKLDSIYKTE